MLILHHITPSKPILVLVSHLIFPFLVLISLWRFDFDCSTVRHFPLDSIDPSLAIGFYCRDKSTFAYLSLIVPETAELVLQWLTSLFLTANFWILSVGDFDDFCIRASKLVDQSNGAPLFTITETRSSTTSVEYNDRLTSDTGVPELDSFDAVAPGESDASRPEDEWQLLWCDNIFHDQKLCK